MAIILHQSRQRLNIIKSPIEIGCHRIYEAEGRYWRVRLLKQQPVNQIGGGVEPVIWPQIARNSHAKDAIA